MRRHLSVSMVFALVVAACGGDGEPAETTTTSPTSSTAGITATTTSAAPGPAGQPTTTEAAVTTGAAATTAPSPGPVTFTTSDGLTLEGRLFPAGSTWVLLGHMRPADMTSWFDFAQTLASEGFTALAYNSRGYGESEGDGFDVGVDARAAVAFARAGGAARIVYVGASMNGTAAVIVAAEEDLAAIAALSAVPTFSGADALERAPEVTEPALFVAARDDASAVDDAELLAAAVQGPAEVVLYDRGGHGTNMFSQPDLAPTLLAFVESHG